MIITIILIIITIIILLIGNKVKKIIIPPKELRQLRGPNIITQIYRLFFSNLPGPYLQREAKEKYGKYMRGYMGSWTMIIHDDELAVKEILKHPDIYEKYNDENARSDTTKTFFGKNIVQENGREWQRLRKICNPAFHWEFLRLFLEKFQESSMKAFHYIEKNHILQTSPKILKYLSDEELMDEGSKYVTVEVVPLMQKLTLDILGNCAFSVNFGSFEEKEGEYVKLYNRIMKNLFFPLNLLFPKYDRIPIASNKQLRSDVKRFEELIQGIIQKRREDLRSKSSDVVERHADLLDMMLENDGGLNDDELRNNMNIFFLAGHDTTSTALSMALNFLAMHKDVQEKARLEARSVIGDKRSISYEDVKELHYITQIIKETLRIWPPVSILPTRVTTDDVILGGRSYPKGTVISLNIYSMHHSAEYWENPEKFDPDRFAPNKKISPYIWLPFGVGPRVCIGNNFSLMEQKVFLASLLLRYKLHVGPVIPSPQHRLTSLNFELSSLNFLTPRNLFLRFEKIIDH